jgi:hypothetical protein
VQTKRIAPGQPFKKTFQTRIRTLVLSQESDRGVASWNYWLVMVEGAATVEATAGRVS